MTPSIGCAGSGTLLPSCRAASLTRPSAASSSSASPARSCSSSCRRESASSPWPTTGDAPATGATAGEQRTETSRVAVTIATPEDVIIAKLEWPKLSASDRQLHDVAGILSLRAHALDLAHIDRWVTDLDLAAEWARARKLTR